MFPIFLCSRPILVNVHGPCGRILDTNITQIIPGSSSAPVRSLAWTKPKEGEPQRLFGSSLNGTLFEVDYTKQFQITVKFPALYGQIQTKPHELALHPRAHESKISVTRQRATFWCDYYLLSTSCTCPYP